MSIDEQTENTDDLKQHSDSPECAVSQEKTENAAYDGFVLWPAWKSSDRVSMVFDGLENQGTAAVRYYDDSMEKIMEDMDADTSITEDLKLLVIRNILNGRWFSGKLDRSMEFTERENHG